MPPFRGLRMHIGRVVRRPFGEPRDKRGFGEGHLTDILVEVCLRSGLDTVRPMAEVNLIQIQLENLIFSENLFHLDGQQCLAHFAPEIPFGRKEQ